MLTHGATRAAVAAALALALASFTAFAQVGSPPPFSESDMKRVREPFGDRPIKQVKSEAEIRAKTPEDVARAAWTHCNRSGACRRRFASSAPLASTRNSSPDRHPSG